MANGGCIDDGDGANNQNSCPDGTASRARTSTTSPPTSKYAGTNKTILPAYAIKNVKGAKIGFIGMTLKDTPDIVTAVRRRRASSSPTRSQTANALVPVLEAQGVNAIVVLIHQGGVPGQQTLVRTRTTSRTRSTRTTTPPAARAARSTPASPDHPDRGAPRPGDRHGRLRATRTSPTSATSRTRRATTALVTSASSFGRLFTDTELTYDRRTQRHRAQLGRGREHAGDPRRAEGRRRRPR